MLEVDGAGIAMGGVAGLLSLACIAWGLSPQLRGFGEAHVFKGLTGLIVSCFILVVVTYGTHLLARPLLISVVIGELAGFVGGLIVLCVVLARHDG